MEHTQLFEWIEIDDQIKKYNEKIKLLRKQRNDVANNMISTLDNKSLPTYNITNMNTSISFQNNKSYENYTDKFYKDCFSEFLKSEEKANQLIKFMKEKRKVKNNIIIKRDYLLN